MTDVIDRRAGQAVPRQAGRSIYGRVVRAERSRAAHDAACFDLVLRHPSGHAGGTRLSARLFVPAPLAAEFEERVRPGARLLAKGRAEVGPAAASAARTEMRVSFFEVLPAASAAGLRA
jgi:hypothetical protein